MDLYKSYCMSLSAYLSVCLLKLCRSIIVPLAVLSAASSWRPLHYATLNVPLLHIITQSLL